MWSFQPPLVMDNEQVAVVKAVRQAIRIPGHQSNRSEPVVHSTNSGDSRNHSPFLLAAERMYRSGFDRN